MGYSNFPEGKDLEKKLGNEKVKTCYELVVIDSHIPRRRSGSNLPRLGSSGFELGRDVILPHQFVHILLLQDRRDGINFAKISTSPPRSSCLSLGWDRLCSSSHRLNRLFGLIHYSNKRMSRGGYVLRL